MTWEPPKIEAKTSQTPPGGWLQHRLWVPKKEKEKSFFDQFGFNWFQLDPRETSWLTAEPNAAQTLGSKWHLWCEMEIFRFITVS